MEDNNVPGIETKKHPGRPRKHESDAARVRTWKKAKKGSGRRLDCHIGDQASWRIGKLAQAWGCSLAAAVERLILEADARYHDILFPAEKDQG